MKMEYLNYTRLKITRRANRDRLNFVSASVGNLTVDCKSVDLFGGDNAGQGVAQPLWIEEVYVSQVGVIIMQQKA